MEKNMIEIEAATVNLKRLHDELLEAGQDEDPVIDLDLLFLDILEAVGLLNDERLAMIIGEGAAIKAMARVTR